MRNVNKQPRIEVHNSGGYTLIELMIVIVIIGIITMIAYPSYRDYVLRSHRADGQIALTVCAASQERWFTKNNTYSTGVSGCSGTSSEGYYSISIAIGDRQINGSCNLGSSTNSDCFLITVAPTSKSNQVEDTVCTSMTLDNTNFKASYDGSGADTKITCWRS